MFVLVHFRHGIDVGKRIAAVAQQVGDGADGVVDLVAGEGFTRLDLHQRLEGGFRHGQIAGKAHVRDSVFFAFADVDGDIHIPLVRADRHLGGVDIELEVTAVQVVRAQTLQVALQLLLGILVVAGQPGQPARVGQGEFVQEIAFFEGLGADDLDLLDARSHAFVDVHGDRHAVAFQLGHLGVDLYRVFALAVILALELLFGLFQHRFIEHARLSQAVVFQGLFQLLAVEFFRAVDVQLGNHRTLGDGDNHHIVFGFDAHIGKKTSGE